MLIKKASGVILYNDEEQKKMIRRGIHKNKIFIADNTMLVENHQNTSSFDKNSIIFVGRLQQRKGIDVLIRSFHKIIDKMKDNIIINVIGIGDEEKKLKSLTNDLGLENRIKFPGKITQSEKLKSYFEKAFAYVSPNHVGLGVLHSFSYGVPVLTSSIKPHAQEFYNLIDGENCLLHNSDFELGNNILKICNNKNLSHKLGTNAYKLYSEVKTFDNFTKGFLDAINVA